MIKIYDYKTGKVREVMLDPGEKNYLCKFNLGRVRETQEARNKTTPQQAA